MKRYALQNRAQTMGCFGVGGGQKWPQTANKKKQTYIRIVFNISIIQK